ncbi:MAG: hypothetical protein IRZ29_07575 [Thermoflavifilum sp.]|nr:hypothetical protein [Thermoflavifilum sp.]
MSWTILLGAIYLILACWWISHWKHLRPPGLSTLALIGLFLSRVAMSWGYGWLHHRYYPGFNDSWKNFQQAVELAHWWYRDPQGLEEYLRGRLHYLLYLDFLGVYHTFWQSSGHYVMLGLQLIFNLFSGSSYYINCIFFSLLTLPGWLRYMELYRLTIGMSTPASLLWFHFPSIWFWFSGMHKDALLLMGLAFLGYHTYRLLQKLSVGRVATGMLLSDGSWIMLSLIGILLLKNFLLLMLLPAWLAWITAAVVKQKWPALGKRFSPAKIFTWGFIGWLVLGLGISWAFHLHPLQVVAERQEAFYRVGVELGAHSVLPPLAFQPDGIDALRVLPAALWRVVVLPNPSTQHVWLQVLVQLNNVLWIVLLTLSLIWRSNSISQIHPWLLLSYWLALAYLLLIGYTVCIAGAMVRYRALAEFFLLAPSIQILYHKHIKKNKIFYFSGG